MKFDATVEVSQFAGHRARLRLLGLFADGWPALLITDPLVENLPDQTTEPVSGRANGLCVPELRNESSIHDREDRDLVVSLGSFDWQVTIIPATHGWWVTAGPGSVA